jgi:phenylacetic acid degradation protein
MRPLRDEEIDWKSQGTGHYHDLARRHLATGRLVEPLTEVEPNRQRVPVIRYSAKHEEGRD